MALKRMTKADHPHSLGAFKPVGHVVVAFADDTAAAAAVRALLAHGFEREDVLEYTAAEENDEMDRMLRQTSDLAGFGYELTLMRRYKRLAADGASWLIVFAPDDERSAEVARIAAAHGALLAEKYNRLVIEDLIP